MVAFEQHNPLVTVCDHPVLHHQLAILRDKNAPPEIFRNAIQRVAQFVLQEATRYLLLADTWIETPITKMKTKMLAPQHPIIAVPILRAGLMMSDVMLNLVPSVHLYHIGVHRDKETLKPVTYYNKLPSTIDYAASQLFILDPMLATGGSISAAVEMMLDVGVPQTNITVASIIAAPEGIKVLQDKFPMIRITTAVIDAQLNDHAYIVPGLGDAGDRAFNTL